MAIAGRVAIVPKGDWSADATYKRLDAVTHNNTLYFAKKDVPAGTETSNTEYWSKSIVGSVVTVDDALSSTSTNPVQNKVVKAYVDKKASENVDFSTSTSKLLNDSIEAQLVLSNATRNLLNPTLATTTLNGVTCTNNGDGTYTLNGTATQQAIFIFANADKTLAMFKGHSSLKLVGFPKKYASAGVLQVWRQSDNLIMRDRGDGVIITGSDMPYGNCNMAFVIYNGAVTDGMIIKPMLTTDLEATYDDFVPYSGYDIKTCGKNLLSPVSLGNNIKVDTNGVISAINTLDDIRPWNYYNRNFDLELQSGEYTVVVNVLTADTSRDYKGVGIVKEGYEDAIVANSNGTFTTTGIKTFSFIISDTSVKYGLLVKLATATCQIAIVKKGSKPTYEHYQESSVHIDSSTEFPLLGLKSFDGETNIISPGNVEVTYAKSDSGKAILDMSENKLDKDNVVNNQTTTEEGFALDARQANPNLDGTLAKQISDLNGSLYGATSNIFSTVTSDSIEFQSLYETKIGNLIILNATFYVKQNIASWQDLKISQYSNGNITILGGMFQSQNTNKAYVVLGNSGKNVVIRTDSSGISNDDWLRGFAIACIASTK